VKPESLWTRAAAAGPPLRTAGIGPPCTEWYDSRRSESQRCDRLAPLPSAVVHDCTGGRATPTRSGAEDTTQEHRTGARCEMCVPRFTTPAFEMQAATGSAFWGCICIRPYSD
jgi:hypothetical protein